MRLLLLALVFLVGCSSTKIVKTEFFKDGVKVKTFIGRGIFMGDEGLGTYKIWDTKKWNYYSYKCERCNFVETKVGESK